MNTRWGAHAVACLLLMGPAGAMAEPQRAETPSTRGTTINLFGGVASASGDAGAVVGGAAGWELTPRVGLEGIGAWLDRPGASEAFAAALNLHLNLTSRRTAVPFVKGGFGLYRASFDTIGEMPSFYRRRFGAAPPLRGTHTFTDPAIVLGGGVNVFLSRHVAVRPELHTLLVTRHSRTHTVTAFTMHLAYHFEEHPVTPERRK